MVLGSFCKALRGRTPLYADALVNEFRKVEQVDRHWELPFRRRYLASKEAECRSIAKSLLIYGFTQWDVNTLLCGAFVAQAVLGAVMLAPISIIISFFALCCLLQLRMHRDKLTLYYSMVSFGSYIILMINLMIVQPENLFSYGGVNAVIATSFVHFVILALLGRHTVGRNFERFADTCLQFKIPTVIECHALLTGVIACLGITFAVVHLYYMAYTCLIVVLFTSFARLSFVVSPKDRDTAESLEHEAEPSSMAWSFICSCLPVVRCVMNVLFTLMSLTVSIATLVDGHILSLGHQDSFKAWESANALIGEYTFSFKALACLMSLSLVIILALQICFFLQMVLRSPRLRNALQRRTIFMGKSCIDRKGNFYYAYYNYTVDSRGYVIDVETIGKSQLNGYDRSSLTCYDIYLAMQRRALHALCQRTIYCHVPIFHLYTAEKDSNALVRNRVRLEKMAAELEELVAQERLRRREARLERERLRRLQAELDNRPQFISTSIPCGLEVSIPSQSVNDTFSEIRGEVDSYKRTFSIPLDMSLQDVDDIPAISRMKDRLYQRRCVTTSVTDDFYWRAPGIIDRVRCSWLDNFDGDPMPSGRPLHPVTSRVVRNPTKGEFNFNKIDNTLSTIFMGLEILNADGQPVRRAMNASNSNMVQCSGAANIDLSDGSFTNRFTPMSNDAPTRPQLELPSPSHLPPPSARSGVVCIDISDSASPPSQLPDDVKSSVSNGANIKMRTPQSVHFIDIDTTKSAITGVEMPQPTLGSSQRGVDAQHKWSWLDETVNKALGNTTVGINRFLKEATVGPEQAWIKNHPDDNDISYDRIRPIEEALEGQYYVNEHGQLVVKSGNRYVPARYHGKRSVKKLAAYFSSPKKQPPVTETIDIPMESDTDEDTYEYDFSKVVTSPTHSSMLYTFSNDMVPKPHLSPHASRYVMLSDSIDNDKYSSRVTDTISPSVITPCRQGTGEISNRSNFILTREYEVYPPFNLTNMGEKQLGTCSAAQVGISNLDNPDNIDEGDVSSLRALGSGEYGGDAIVTASSAVTSPRTMRRIAAAQHLPLALDSRHEKVYHVFPESRRDHAIMDRAMPHARAYVDSVATTPSSTVAAHRQKMNGSTGCDFTNRYTESGGDSVTSPGSSVATQSASATPVHPVLPRRQWRNEFDFSPVTIHSAEDVMRELMRDVDMGDSGAEDHGSDVSYDFIFGR
ncbi:hypothetical protein X943_000169 [Babesia divergens]|uniref:Transmembrane protein n=1 Tax=Babesia divergens TaxID=32595 RepID=A0AAD9G6C6_BABDI|nr:hypothetical protein X943_000169 [Babesia divergens]